MCAALCALPAPATYAQGILQETVGFSFRLYDFGSVPVGSTSSSPVIQTGLPFPMGDPLVDAAVLAAPNPVGDVADFDLTLFPTVSFTPTGLGLRAAARDRVVITDVPVILGSTVIGFHRFTNHVVDKFAGVGVVPEPGSLALLASGVAPGAGMLLRRRRGLLRDAGAEPEADPA